MMPSSMLTIGEVVEPNIKGGKDRFGNELGRHMVYVRIPSLMSPETPDPVLDHPIPVMTNWHHTEGRKDWDGQLPPKTIVYLAKVDVIPGLNESDWIVVGWNPPNSDQIYSDTRSTSHYSQYPDGTGIKIVDADKDPIEGNNEDVGYTIKTPESGSAEVRFPYPDDPTRMRGEVVLPGGNHIFEWEDMLDETSIKMLVSALVSGATIRLEQTESPPRWEFELQDGSGQKFYVVTQPAGSATFQFQSKHKDHAPKEFQLLYAPPTANFQLENKNGGTFHKILSDQLSKLFSIQDEKGNYINLDSATQIITLNALLSVAINAAVMTEIKSPLVNISGNLVNLGVGALLPVARVGDAVVVIGPTGPLAGTIVSGSLTVKAA